MSDDLSDLSGNTVPFESLGVPTRATAKTVWDQTPNPSTRKVAEKMRNLGWKVSAKTISRWHNDGWQEPVAEPGKKSRLEHDKARRKAKTASETLDRIAVLKDDPEVRAAAEAVVKATLDAQRAAQEFESSKFDDLIKMSKESLKEKLDKTIMAAGVMISEAIIRHRDQLAGLPKDMGSFLNDMSEASSNMRVTNDDIPPFAEGMPGDGAKLINGTAMAVPQQAPVNPTADAIRRHKAKHGLGVVS